MYFAVPKLTNLRSDTLHNSHCNNVLFLFGCKLQFCIIPQTNGLGEGFMFAQHFDTITSF